MYNVCKANLFLFGEEKDKKRQKKTKKVNIYIIVYLKIW